MHCVSQFLVGGQMMLLCKQHLIPFYASAGFEDLGVSDVVHGKDPWQLMAQPALVPPP